MMPIKIEIGGTLPKKAKEVAGWPDSSGLDLFEDRGEIGCCRALLYVLDVLPAVVGSPWVGGAAPVSGRT